MIYSTLLNNTYGGYGIALDPTGNFYLTGLAYPDFLTTPDAYLPTSANENPFVAKFTQELVGAPEVSSISPDHGAIAAFVTITGSNFGVTEGSGYVQVNGAKSDVISWSDTAITVRVPYNGAPGAGSIMVTADGDKSNAEPFTLLAFPTVTNVSVATGIPGTR